MRVASPCACCTRCAPSSAPVAGLPALPCSLLLACCSRQRHQAAFLCLLCVRVLGIAPFSSRRRCLHAGPSAPRDPMQGAFAQAGIEPSDSRTYAAAALERAVRAAYGVTPLLVCSYQSRQRRWLLQEVRLCVGLDLKVGRVPAATDVVRSCQRRPWRLVRQRQQGAVPLACHALLAGGPAGSGPGCLCSAESWLRSAVLQRAHAGHVPAEGATTPGCQLLAGLPAGLHPLAMPRVSAPAACVLQARDCPEGVLADHACEGHARCGDHVLLPVGTAEVGRRRSFQHPHVASTCQHPHAMQRQTRTRLWATLHPYKPGSRALCTLLTPPTGRILFSAPRWQVPDECSEFIPSWGPGPEERAPQAGDIRCLPSSC